MTGSVPHVRLGIFIVIGIALFFVGVFLVGQRELIFASSYKLQAQFPDVAGLEEGAPVRVSGVQKGIVEEIRLPPTPAEKVTVVMKLDGDVQRLIKKDGVAHIETEGLLGRKYIGIAPGSPGAASAQDGDIILSREPVDYTKIIDQAARAVDSANNALQTLGEIARKINEGESSVGRLINDDRLYRDVQQVLFSARRATSGLESVAMDIRRGRGTLGKLASDETLYRELEQTVASARRGTASLQQVMAGLEQGQGTIGRLLKDEQVYRDLKDTLASAKRSSQNLETLINDINSGQGPLGSLLKGDENGEGIPSTLAALREGAVNFSEVMEALKHNFLLRGFFRDRGYWSELELTENELQTPPSDRTARGFTFQASELFDADDADAKLENEKKLNRIGEYLLDHPDSLVVIESYTSRIGERENNLKLSRARAVAVRNYLASRFPLDDKRIKTKGYGEDHTFKLRPQRGEGLIRILLY